MAWARLTGSLLVTKYPEELLAKDPPLKISAPLNTSVISKGIKDPDVTHATNFESVFKRRSW
jgi:hypothetical protein